MERIDFDKIHSLSLRNSAIAEILGAFIGDGWIESDKCTFYIAGSPTEDKSYYDEFIAPVFSKLIYPVKAQSFSYWGVYGIRLTRQAIINKLVQIGFTAGPKAKIVKIPIEVIRGAEPELCKSIIRRIFDTDGSFYCKKAYGQYDSLQSKLFHQQPRIVIVTTSQSLCIQLCWLLPMIGIKCTSSHKPARRCANRNNSHSFTVKIDRLEDIDRFFSIIGTRNERHWSRYLFWKEFGHLPAYTDVSYRRAVFEVSDLDQLLEPSTTPHFATPAKQVARIRVSL